MNLSKNLTTESSEEHGELTLKKESINLCASQCSLWLNSFNV